MENIQSSESLPCQHGMRSSLDLELLENDVPINTKKNCSSSTPEFTSYDLTIALLGAAAGNCLEWFNFSLFGLMADIFGELFFPPSNATLHLFQVYGIYAGMSLMRPLGGLVFGVIGDRYGRVYSLKLSIIIMAVTTFLTAVLPTYDTIGVTATFLMIAVRLLQGLSVGAELPSAMIYVVEVCPPKHRAVFAILVQITGFGGLLGSAFVTVLSLIFTEQQILNWAWRIPFIFGSLIGVLGIWSRIYLSSDSPAFVRTQQHGDVVDDPILYALRTCKLRMFSIVMHCTFLVFQYFILFQWLSTYFRVIEGYTFNSYAINMVAMLLCAFGSLITAHWIDSVRNMTSSKVICIFGPIQVILATVSFQYIDHSDDKQHHELLTILIWLLLSFSFALYYGSAAAIWYIDMLPDVKCRNTAFGLAYNVGALWGGMATLIATFVENEFGGISAVGWTLLIFGCVSIGNDIISSRFIQRSTTIG